ncbi:hypothetical protein [Pseudomonas aeruginosa]|uniref:hypothetical protein n=1 Tax=Pseudomonas aeruginosa TaxID=287 RepID=UPI00141AEF74|nr:hypothetical protein [Pseudomonas aeruginosa]
MKASPSNSIRSPFLGAGMSCPPELHWRHDDLDITLLDQRTVDNPHIVVLAHAGTIEAALDGWASTGRWVVFALLELGQA